MSVKYRKQDADGDYVFGHSLYDFYNNIDAVTQAICTNLKLLEGEWWEDVKIGTPFFNKILGTKITTNTQQAIDLIVKDRILQTEGVSSVLEYNSELDVINRTLSFTAKVKTIYGVIEELTVDLINDGGK